VAHPILCDMTLFTLIVCTKVSLELSASIFRVEMYFYFYTLKMNAEISCYPSTLKMKRVDFYLPHYIAASQLRRLYHPVCPNFKPELDSTLAFLIH
jgi:hypothetical protein